MKRTLKYLTCAAVTTAALAGMATVSYAIPAKAPHGTVAEAGAAQTRAASASKARTVTATQPTAKKTAPTPRIVASGEHVTAVPGFELWLTAEGKHWTTPSSPDPQFRSVVDGNIDRNTPGVSLQSEITDDNAYFSGLYYGGKGTASRVEIETADGTVHGKLIELPGKPGWGVWYATAGVKPGSGSWDYVSRVTVHDTKGKVYARLTLR
ncbi:hypothetical protein ACWDAO_28650 [Streptomyces sp. NPDC001212]|uniref:hypothetical protein n=1 Tax=unclassified Streptomyces TaxID=2593676 RepID=UPI001CD63F9A|nr:MULTISPECIES: hypothetical protein [unclassified Streptomyces]